MEAERVAPRETASIEIALTDVAQTDAAPIASSPLDGAARAWTSSAPFAPLPRSRASAPLEAGVSHAAQPLPSLAPPHQAADDGAAAAGSAIAALVARLNEWLRQVAAVRDAIVSLPPFPALLWVLGAALIAALTAVRVQRSRRLILRSRLAPPSVERMIADAAEHLQLRRVPRVLMTQSRVSPMVWCGAHPCIVLPADLWSQLDDDGRRAIILHELAHLKRRDHLWCWVELAAGCVYWWHPVVWWVRKRLRDEADDCCDAWVTNLMPASRRAYAQALLEARRFTSEAQRRQQQLMTPAVGLGGPTRSARKLARRLTMVMTHNISPKLSARGVMLCGAVALLAYVATPMFACPPEDDAAAKAKAAKAEKAVKADKAAKEARASRAPRAFAAPPPPSAPAPPLPPPAPDAPSLFDGGDDDETTFERHMRGMEERDIDRLPPEQQLEHYKRRLHELERQLDELRREAPAPGAMFNPAPPATAGFMAPTVAVAPNHVIAFTTDGGCTVQCQARAETKCTQNRAALLLGTAMGALGDQEEIAQSYAVSNQGKREALLALMLREDVPVRVSGGDGAITVHGPENAHMIMQAFIAMINSDEERAEEYRVSPRKLEALTELMVRDDVPIMVRRGDDHIGVQGNELEQLVFSAFIRLIDSDEESAEIQPARPLRRGGGGAGGAAGGSGGSGGAAGGGRGWSTDSISSPQMTGEWLAAYERAAQLSPELAADVSRKLREAYARLDEHAPQAVADARRKLEEAYAQMAAKGVEIDRRAIEDAIRGAMQRGRGEEALANGRHMSALHQLLAELETRRAEVNNHEATSQRLAAQSERLHEQVEQLQEQAEALAEAARHFDGGDRQAIDEKARQLELRARQIERQAAVIERQAELAEARFERLEDEIEALEEQIEDLEELDDDDEDDEDDDEDEDDDDDEDDDAAR